MITDGFKATKDPHNYERPEFVPCTTTVLKLGRDVRRLRKKMRANDISTGSSLGQAGTQGPFWRENAQTTSAIRH